ncbi:sugar phosphate isomerase/epimerase family protein [Mucisphaera calidilacus]|uniref:Fructoselysine 3-epimerase n=1 Tax=Mucisphaera calidilacus TaxID=2527982 RepID=A0A518BUW9_9BACT|nr:sugar phosphate isomerase/epimerase family protein [Mucisphaera calidilacus]QDU70780.1 fructoselysine 3-epimerase [Mucisphaera calidilacus]
MAYLSAVVPFGYSDFTGEGLLKLYKRLGCETIQVQRHPEKDPPAAELRQKTEDAGLRVDSLHGRFGVDLDPSSPSASMRAETMRVAIEDAAYCAALGGECVVLHPSTSGTVTGSNARQSRLVEFLGELEGPARDHGVRFLLENLPPIFPLGGHAVDLIEVLAQIRSDRYGLILDTGHANMAENPKLQFDTMFEGGLSAMHVHDNKGVLDNHLWPGEGTVDWKQVSSRIDELGDIPLALEVFPMEAQLEARIEAGAGDAVRRLLGLDS